jgi:hypothetical protein
MNKKSSKMWHVRDLVCPILFHINFYYKVTFYNY